ncbi:MAG: methyl-accepting chemotaxis protein, partial [Arcobacter sp.]|nr:methyl-accepting chemotaxis protein [Arcobacter sp.]
MNNLSIKYKFLGIVILSIIIISVISLFNSIQTINNISNQNIENYKKDLYKKTENELKSSVQVAHKIIDSFYKRTSKEKIKAEVKDFLMQQMDFLYSIIENEYKKNAGIIPDEELEDRLKGIIESTRYGQSGYFWINDTDAVMVMYPIKPELNGKDLYDYKDKNGKQIFKEFAKVAKYSNSGFVDYVWPKPGYQKPQNKISYVKLFSPFNWVIGTGEYVDNVTKKLQKEALKTISEIRYGKNGYYWINDSSPKMIMHPIKPELNGKDLSKSKDSKGKLLFKEMVRTTSESKEGGIVKYLWSKPGFKEPQPKFSFVQKFEPWDWIIGTGSYVDEIDKKISFLRNETKKNISEVIYKNILYTFISILVVIALTILITNKIIIYPIKKLENGILDFFNFINRKTNELKTIDIDSNDELGNMAKTINKNIKRSEIAITQENEIIDDIKQVVASVKEGNFNNRITKESSNESLTMIKDTLNSLFDNLENLLNEMNNAFKKLAHGEFDATISVQTKGEYNKTKKSIDMLSNSLSELDTSIQGLINNIDKGDFSYRLENKNYKGSMLVMANGLNSLASNIDSVFKDINTNIKQVALGDLTVSINEQHKGEYLVLAKAINNTIEQIKNVIQTANNSTTQIVSGLNEVSSASSNLSRSATLQASSLEETSVAIEEMASNIKISTDNIHNTSAIAKDVSVMANDGGTSV